MIIKRIALIYKKVFDKLVSIHLNIYYMPYKLNMLYFGKKVVLKEGLRIDHPECLDIGNNVFINSFAWLSIGKLVYQKDSPTIENSPILKIDDGTYIGRFVSISCANSVYIGKKVLIADRCYIGDIQHNFENKELAIMDQYIIAKGDIAIGDETWIGNNVSILPSVKIGKHCVIGANSVVTKDVPDYHIAVGNPASILRKI